MMRFVLVIVMAFGMSVFADDHDEQQATPDRSIQLEQLPEGVLEAAREAKPGVHFTAAEQVWWRDEPVYRIMGSQFRTDWNVYVNVQGDIRHIDSDRREGVGR